MANATVHNCESVAKNNSNVVDVIPMIFFSNKTPMANVVYGSLF